MVLQLLRSLSHQSHLLLDLPMTRNLCIYNSLSRGKLILVGKDLITAYIVPKSQYNNNEAHGSIFGNEQLRSFASIVPDPLGQNGRMFFPPLFS